MHHLIAFLVTILIVEVSGESNKTVIIQLPGSISSQCIDACNSSLPYLCNSEPEWFDGIISFLDPLGAFHIVHTVSVAIDGLLRCNFANISNSVSVSLQGTTIGTVLKL